MLLSAAMSKEEFDSEAKLLLAAKFYELGKLTSGQAARLSGHGRVDFLLALPRIGVSIVNLQSEDAEAEVRVLRNERPLRRRQGPPPAPGPGRTPSTRRPVTLRRPF